MILNQLSERGEVVVIKSGVVGEKISEAKGRGLLIATFFFPALAIALALAVGSALGTLDSAAGVLVAGVFLFILVLALRQYGLAVTLIIAAHIYIDWYLGLEIVGIAAAIGLFLLFLLFLRSSEYPWVTPRALWLWALFLALAIPPALRGAQGRYELAYYYPNIFFGALLMFWLGMLVSGHRMHLKSLFQVLTLLGTLFAIHTIIEYTTGIFVFKTARLDTYLTQVLNFGLIGSDINRVGSLLLNPDWNGTFFATLLFLPLGLFAEETVFVKKVLYSVAILLLSCALFATYSIGAWIGAFAGILVFALFVGRNSYLLLVPVLMVIAALVLIIVFPAEVKLQIQHASNPAGLSLRLGAWQTALNVIRAFPLTGIGLGLTNYLQRADPYRVPAQYRPLVHPHNSYLELGAMAGLPVLLVFLALLLTALWWSWCNWKQVDGPTRSLLGGGIAAVMALSVNSLSINGWTIPPMAAIGWVILGAMSSPLLAKKYNNGAVR